MTEFECWLTSEEAMAYLRVSENKFYRLCRQGKMPAHKIGNLWRVKLSELDEAVRSGRLSSNPAEQRK